MLIVGIGNPGAQYERTRHNVGFEVIDELAKRRSVEEFVPFRPASDGFALIAETKYAGRPVVLAKPQTYVNCSGPVVQALLGQYQCAVKDCLIVIDDINLPVGQLRLRGKGSDGGHNGMASIIEAIGGATIARLRLGVGAPDRQGGLVDHVLGPFSAEERPVIDAQIATAADAAQWWVRSGLQAAMNKYNAAPAQDDDSSAGAGADPEDPKGATP
ncbi:MAG: aminoacyl-tRNA hydrolase [Planctomycetota bacterium]